MEGPDGWGARAWEQLGLIRNSAPRVRTDCGAAAVNSYAA